MDALRPAVVDIDEILDWALFDIPGGSAPVRLHVLRDESDTRARTLLVRFPAGWERTQTGYYESAEELVVLDGTLRMCGATYDPGDWGFVHAGTIRFGMSVDRPTLVLARFFGPARWVAAATAPAAPWRSSLDDAAMDEPSPLGAGRATPLRAGESWFVDDVPGGMRAAADTELLSPPGRVWTWTPAGEPFPDLDGPCFCRTFPGD